MRCSVSVRGTNDAVFTAYHLQEKQMTANKPIYVASIYLYLSLLRRSFTDHHLRYGGWLNLEFSKREKHSGWAIKTIY